MTRPGARSTLRQMLRRLALPLALASLALLVGCDKRTKGEVAVAAERLVLDPSRLGEFGLQSLELGRQRGRTDRRRQYDNHGITEDSPNFRQKPDYGQYGR